MKTIATYSIKGGVGKTSTAVNVAYEAARSGARVLLWDLDPQGAATYFFRIRAKVKGGGERLVGPKGGLAEHLKSTDAAGLDVVPADFSLRHLDLYLDATKHRTERLADLLQELASGYDLAILDCAPSISLVSENVFGATDALIVPVVPSTLSSRTLGQLTDYLADRMAPQVLAYFCIVDRRRKLHREMVDATVGVSPLFLQTVIPNSSLIERMGVERSPVGAFAGSSSAAEAFRALWSEIAARLWGGG